MRRGSPPGTPCHWCGHPYRVHTAKHRETDIYEESCARCSCYSFKRRPIGAPNVGSHHIGNRALLTRKANMKKVAAGKARCSCCGKAGAVPFRAEDAPGLTFNFRPECAKEGWTRA